MEEQHPPHARSDRGSVLIAASVIGAALILSWGMSSSQPRYQLAGSGDMVVRMNTDSGELIACNPQRCARIEPPDRARTFGPLTHQIGDSKERPKLPPPETNQAR
jgi:hypothetical protein